MLSHPTGVIGLPLRLLAREVYNRVVERVGPAAVALVTGEEKIKPREARYWVATAEAMPRDVRPDFVGVDEIQLAADFERGHVFTDRILNSRGRAETLLIGASTMAQALERVVPGVPVVARPRLSRLSYAGPRKISRLPRRSAIIAFSAEEVYAIAEWIRRQRGGAAVVLGALSPRTRNAQIDLYQNGEVDYIVATDAIGMGLNLDVDHIAFASDRKFDGWHFRRLTPAEFSQIAGRAGRHVRDGTFGTTGRCAPFDPPLIEAIEDHRLDAVTMLQWRNADLDFSSIRDLQHSLDRTPGLPGLARAPIAEDQLVLDIAARDEDIARQARIPADVARLWDACQVPDYRKLSPSAHADLVQTIFRFIVRRGRIPDDWFARQIAIVDRTDGDIDALSARIAQVRTWSYSANRPDWLNDPEHWQAIARQVEDRLSDALHERLAQRFIDRRTILLMRRLRENMMVEAEISATGDVLVEGQHVGTLQGFRFTPDQQAGDDAAKAQAAAAQQAATQEIENRVARVVAAVDDAFVLAHDGLIRWLGEPVGRLEAGDKILAPRVRVLADDLLGATHLESVRTRLGLWLDQHVRKLLGTLFTLEAGEGLEGVARGIAFRLAEELGVVERGRVVNDVRGLSQEARGSLRKLGVRFGAYHVFVPALIKPAARALAAQLWALKHGGLELARGLDEVAHFAASGRTSFAADPTIAKALYRAAGFRVSGERAVRVDILERLADLIRPAIAYRPGITPGDPPTGAADGNGFVVTVGMTSLAGCSGEPFASILRSLGYSSEQRNGPAITVPLLPKASTEPVQAAPAGDVAAAEEIAPPEDIASAEGAAPTEEAASPDEAELLPAPADAAEMQSAAAESPEPDAEPPEEQTIADTVEVAAVEQTPAADDAAYFDAATDIVLDMLQDAPVIAPTAAPLETADPAAAASPEATTTEPTLIEVWRPARVQHARKPQRPFQGQRERGPAPAARTAAAPQDGAAKPNGAGGPRDRNRGERFDKFAKRPRPPARDDRPPRHPRPERERAPDPDSPFAKLLALKAELEKKGS
jgi:ATP-dependent RNA helicase SUPV3L1/SUV3